MELKQELQSKSTLRKGDRGGPYLYFLAELQYSNSGD
jgi:hypothetical protein